jgi:hypothetical protein
MAKKKSSGKKRKKWSNESLYFLSNSIVPLSDRAQEAINKLTLQRRLSRGGLLLSNGGVCKEFHFLARKRACSFGSPQSTRCPEKCVVILLKAGPDFGSPALQTPVLMYVPLRNEYQAGRDLRLKCGFEPGASHVYSKELHSLKKIFHTSPI